MQTAAATRASTRSRAGSGPAEVDTDVTDVTEGPGASGAELEAAGRAGAPAHRRGLRLVRPGESGTTTAEYTVVTAAAVAFGALLLKLLTGGWGQRILEVAFRAVIKMLGF